MDKLGGIDAFMSAAQTRSFVAAGRELGISASAVGKAIARLEQRLGARLFHRSTRSVALTAEGSRFLLRCRRIVDELKAAEDEIAQANAVPRGPLRVSLPVAGSLFLPALAEFMRLWPDVQLELDFTDRLVDLIEEGFDIAVRTGDATDSRLMSRSLGAYRHRIVASPAYLAGAAPLHAPEDLLGHACLHHRHPVTGKLEAWPLLRDGVAMDLALPVAAVASTLEARIHLAEQGLGFACLPDYAVGSQIDRGTLVPVLDDFVESKGIMRVLWPTSRHLALKTRVFVDHLATRLFSDQS